MGTRAVLIAAAVLSPVIAHADLSVEVHESERVNLFANFGVGLHSEPSDPTRRFGVELKSSLAATAWLSVDANLAVAQGLMGSGGATVRHGTSFVTFVATGYPILDLVVGKKLGTLELNLTINNVVAIDWREAQVAASYSF